jgi:hypothetical protein
LSIKNNITKQVEDLQQAAGKEAIIGEKLDELIALLNTSDINSEATRQLQQRFNKAIDDKEVQANLNAFKRLDTDQTSSREQLLDEFTILLSANPVDSNLSKKHLRTERFSKIVLVLISIVMITLGLAMIVMPAPPYFEMFTIYYFTPDDGVTLMDLISLLIVLAGVYLLIKSQLKLTDRQKRA